MPPDPLPAEPIDKKAVIFFGMTASGKSFLAKRWAQQHGFPYFNTDIIRKRLVSEMELKPVESGINVGIYSQELSKRTYKTLFQAAHDALTGPDKTVVLDGSFIKRQNRNNLRSELAGCCKFVFVYCHCAEAITRKRLAQRQDDETAVSDGTWEVFLHQQKIFEQPDELPKQQLMTLDTDRPIDQLIATLDLTLL